MHRFALLFNLMVLGLFSQVCGMFISLFSVVYP